MVSINPWQAVARAGMGFLAASSLGGGAAARTLPSGAAVVPAPSPLFVPAPGPPFAPAPAPPPAALASPPTPPAPASGKVFYHGGPVLNDVKVSTVFWEDTRVGADDVNQFFANLTGSSYLDLLSQYASPGNTLGHGSWVGTATLAKTNPQTIAMTDELNALVQQGALPPPDSNSVYFFFLPPGANVCSNDACGWHTYYGINGTTVPYAAIFDPGDCSCSWGSLFDSMTTIASHELAESITDPIENAGSETASSPKWPTFVMVTPGGWGSIRSTRYGPMPPENACRRVLPATWGCGLPWGSAGALL